MAETATNAAVAGQTSSEPKPAEVKAKAPANVMAEVMEGVTLSSLLILFSFLWMEGATFYLTGSL